MKDHMLNSTARLLAAEMHDEGYINPNRDTTWQRRMENKYRGKPYPANRLPPDTFTKSGGEIARLLKGHSDDFEQAMSRLNSYINRQGRNLKGADRQRLYQAKDALRQAYGEQVEPEKPVQEAGSILFNNDNATVGYDEQEINPIDGDMDAPDSPFIGIRGSAELPVMPIPGVHNLDDGYLKTGLDDPYVEQPSEPVKDAAVPLNAATRLVND